MTMWVGVVGPLCIFCLVLSYLLQQPRLRGGICPAVPMFVVPELGRMLALRECESTKVNFRGVRQGLPPGCVDGLIIPHDLGG